MSFTVSLVSRLGFRLRVLEDVSLGFHLGNQSGEFGVSLGISLGCHLGFHSKFR